MFQFLVTNDHDITVRLDSINGVPFSYSLGPDYEPKEIKAKSDQTAIYKNPNPKMTYLLTVNGPGLGGGEAVFTLMVK